MKKAQTGFFLIEAMVAVLILALGILGMVAMGSTAVASQSDARYRTDAASLAEEIAGVIALNVDRTTDASIQTTVATFQHLPTGAAANGSCAFSGAPSGVLDVTNWATKAYTPSLGGLPGADATNQQIVVDNSTNGHNRVAITVCWHSPSDTDFRHYTLVTYIN